MTVAEIVVTVGGVAAGAWVLWYFVFAPGPAPAAAAKGGVQEVRITVKGGYTPDTVVVRAGKPVRLLFYRDETAEGSDRVVFEAFGIGRYVKNLAPALLDADPELRLVLFSAFLRGHRARARAHAWPDARARRVSVRFPGRLVPFLARLGYAFDRRLAPFDLFHHTDYAVTPLRTRRRVVTVYDTAWLPGRGGMRNTGVAMSIVLASGSRSRRGAVRVKDSLPSVLSTMTSKSWRT